MGTDSHLRFLQKYKLGVPIRDMRLLDPNLLTSETGKILVRDNVIVVSMEHVRVIITADCVIIPREGFEHSPVSVRFNSFLEEVVAEYAEVRRSHLCMRVHWKAAPNILPRT